MSSTTTQMDRKDHPFAYFTINSILWILMLFFVAVPFGLVCAFLLVFIRPVSNFCSQNEVLELLYFLEICQLMPETCIDHLFAGSDFVQVIDSRFFAVVGTPV
uniref:Uncharacterized protein n=2 Tax=Arion vulgaris TaxID=1028688 RepID=A0A0B7A0F4_9EUPU